MKAVWRYIHAARNSYAALYAACETYGFILEPAEASEGDVVCYSLNSIEFPRYKDEIAAADQITIAGGPHASAAWEEVVEVADYVVIGEGERTLPRLLSALATGGPVRTSPVLQPKWAAETESITPSGWMASPVLPG